MAVLLTSARDTACNSIVDMIDTGGAGTLELVVSSSGLVVASIGFSATAFGASSVGVATANVPIVDTSADVGGTVDAYYMKAGTGETIMSGDVGTAGQDIVLNTNVITMGDSVTISSLTVTVPAGTP